MTKLELAVEKLYEVFAAYPAPQSPPFGVGCYAPNALEKVAKLLEPPLRQIDFHAIQDYAMTAYSDWGDSKDFRYFLPRVLEMLAFHDDKWIDNEFVFSRIGDTIYSEFPTWSAQEQAAVFEFCLAWWEIQFSYDYESTFENDESNLGNRIWYHNWMAEYLRGLFIVYSDPTPFLDHWLNDNALNPTLNFAEFTMAFFTNPDPISRTLNWGNHTGTEYASIKAWFLRSPCLEKLQKARIDFKDHTEVSIITEAIEVLQLEKSA